MKTPLRALGVVLLLALAGGGWLAWEAHGFLASAPEQPGREVFFDVTPGARLAQVAAALAQKGLVTDARKFGWLARWKNWDSRSRILYKERQKMKEKVIEILKNNIEELEGVEISGSTQLITSGYIDSFDIINVISLLEQEFNTSIDLEDIELEQFDTVDSICAILEGKA